MSNNYMFRTSAFGGFKKEDVMNFVERVLFDKNELELQLKRKNDDFFKLQTELESLRSQVNELSELRTQLAETLSKVTACEEAMEDKDDIIEGLTERLSKQSNNEELLAQIENLKKENISLKADLDKSRDLERQVGVAMLDAHAHSEQLVEEAKVRADSVTKSIYNAIGEAALKIDDLSAGIGEIARNFTKSVEEVELRIKVLTGDMSKTAQALISENSTGEFVASVSEYDFGVHDINNSCDGNIGDSVNE